jgi:CRISPR-associated protein Csy2
VVPIPIGYGALGDIHPAGTVANARDDKTPFRFVESLYSIGQWVAPHRLTRPEQLLWYADSRLENGLYRCRNHYSSEERH